jgi:hypothetical protein
MMTAQLISNYLPFLRNGEYKKLNPVKKQTRPKFASQGWGFAGFNSA